MTIVSIIGLGWLGLPLAQHLLTQQYTVKGSTTTPEKLPILAAAGIEAHLLQLRPHPDGDLRPLLDADTLVVNVPPKAGQFGDRHHPEQMRLLAGYVATSRIRHIIYVSSTSVYPELNREMTEADVTTPAQSAAPALVESETHWLGLAGTDRAVTVVRCAGLMGAARIPGRYVAGRTVDSGTLPVNYIHQADAVGTLAALLEQQRQGRSMQGTYNAVAPLHPTREAIYRTSCAEFGYVLPTFVAPTEPIPFKIISGAKLTAATGYVFAHPDPLTFPYIQG
jgi:nucleoside-diphosphate-sugar epimerase